MRFSDNGWPGIEDRADTFLSTVLGLNIRTANADVALVFTEFIKRFDKEVEPIAGKVLDDWSWAWRNVRGSTTALSCHASATAIDLNALKHPRGVSNTFTSDQVAHIRRILAAFKGYIKWGKDFHGTTDEMHFQINGTKLQIKKFADSIRAAQAAKELELPTVKDVWSGKDADLIPRNKIDDPKVPVDPANATWRPASILEEIDRLVRLLVARDAEREAQLAAILEALKKQ